MPPTQNKLSIGFPYAEYVKVVLFGAASPGVIDRDILVQFKNAYKFFCVANIQFPFQSSAVYLHFTPLNLPKVTGSNFITPSGSENWLPLANGLNSPSLAEARWLRLHCPIDHFFVDMDHPAGIAALGLSVIFAGSNDVMEINSERR